MNTRPWQHPIPQIGSDRPSGPGGNEPPVKYRPPETPIGTPTVNANPDKRPPVNPGGRRTLGLREEGGGGPLGENSQE